MSSSRYFNPSTARPINLNHGQELLASIDRINTFNPPVQTCSTGWSFTGIYSGGTSIAFLFLRLSHLYPTLVFKGQLLREWSEVYISLSGPHGFVNADKCGIASEPLTWITVKACLENDESLVRQICAHERAINAQGSDGSNEWLYGRAGYLYYLRMLRQHFSSQAVQRLLDSTIKKTIERILSVPSPWRWYEQLYLGAAHGIVGIIAQVLLSDSSYATHAIVLEQLQFILDQQLDNGSLPPVPPLSAAYQADDRLVQFCHGSPGFAICLNSIRNFFKGTLHERLELALTRAREDVRTRGYLTKSPCLCHGIAGNAAVFSNYNAQDAEDQGSGVQGDFERFLNEMTTEQLESNPEWMEKAGREDEFVGLWTGEAGRAWIWACADTGTRGLLGFDDV